MEKQFKVAFEDHESGLFEIHKPGSSERGQFLTKEEFRKLQELMPAVTWIRVCWVKPEWPSWHPGNPANREKLY